jgi:hypothetical protein
VQGYHGDTSATFFCGDVDDEARKLVQVTLWNGALMWHPFVSVVASHKVKAIACLLTMLFTIGVRYIAHHLPSSRILSFFPSFFLSFFFLIASE